jgi:Double zinc ribbon
MDALDRMFQVLVRTLRAKQPALLSAPFTVAELHQQILPYRHFRRDLGLETNQEYELILMELLSGARGYLDVDERLRDRLGKELNAASPEPARVRDFADAHVAINAAALGALADGQTATAASPAAAPGVGLGMAAAVRAAGGGGPRCRYCDGDLPMGRPLHFCPHCGQNLQVLNCPACGAEVEAGWKFCVACGKAVS